MAKELLEYKKYPLLLKKPSVNLNRLRRIILAFAIAGIIISSYALYHHLSADGSSFCNVGEEINCDLVNRGPYARIFGIPVSLIGIIGYGLIFILGLSVCRNSNNKRLPLVLMFLSLGGLFFSIYLTYIEIFILQTICLICVTSLALITAIFALSYFYWKKFK